MLHIGKER
jgi:hypothetical protein